jgi:hypothetical protein
MLDLLDSALDCEAPGKPIPASLPGIGPFGPEVRQLVTEAGWCEPETDLALSAATSIQRSGALLRFLSPHRTIE